MTEGCILVKENGHEKENRYLRIEGGLGIESSAMLLDFMSVTTRSLYCSILKEGNSVVRKTVTLKDLHFTIPIAFFLYSSLRIPLHS